MRALRLSFSSFGWFAVLVSGCGSSSPPPAAPPIAPVATAAPAAEPATPTVATSLEAVGLDASALDRSTQPCNDFYQFACGGWIAKTEIPADKSRWARGFSEVFQRNEAELRAILEDAAKAKSDDPALKKLGGFYGACMDEAAVEKAGTKPLADIVASIKKVNDPKTLAAALFAMHKRKLWAVFDIAASPDYKDATRMIAELDQNGLGLPDRDYYTKDDEKSKELREKYAAHVERMLKLTGLDAKAAKAAAADVLAVDTELAKVSKTRVERRDPNGLHNKIDRAGLAKSAPGFPWDDYFKGLGHPGIQDVNVTSVPYFEGVNALLKSVKPASWRSYLTFQLVHHAAGQLPKAFVDEDFTLQQTLGGQKELPARWKRCVGAVDRGLGELLGQPFIKKKFSPESKAAAEAMVLAISREFERAVEVLDWMDPKTRENALGKMKMMAYLIGYPGEWKTYDFAVDPKSYAGNALAAAAFDLDRNLKKVGKPVDRKEWQMTPPTVNAYYNPQQNHMAFPAGILQPPFYSPKANVAVNFGGIGMVVGHEVTHGFDDEGSKFAGDGNLVDWWRPETSERFKARTQCVVDQYAGYETLPGVKLNGNLTLGENVADIAGVMLALRAYRETRKGAKELTVADGFNEDQQFFLALGQAWCGKQTDESARLLAQVDPHSPPRFRVNGSLANLPDFAKTFSCAEGSPMRPAKVCKVW